MKRKVLLVVIDALTARVVSPAIQSGRLSTLKSLLDAGGSLCENISSFPSITPAATCSIITGEYSVGHGIAGAFWKDGDAESIAYYGDDFWALMNKGLGEYFDDYLLKLNTERLKAPTLFEQVENAGLSAACINYMWFQGIHQHEANTPLLLDLIPGVRSHAVINGPSVLALADFVMPKYAGRPDPSDVSGGVLKRFGFHDDVTGDYLVEMAQAEEFPDFTVAYLPNNDFESHKVGPEASLSVIETVDRRLGEFIEAMGGLESVLDEFSIVVTGDHSHSEVCEDPEQRCIAIKQLLSDFDVASGGSQADSGQLLVCPNMRATQIYTHRTPDTDPATIAVPLLHDERVDQFIVRDHDDDDQPVYYVTTRDRGTLRFCEAGISRSLNDENSTLVQDEYGNRWCISGSLEAVGATVDNSNPGVITSVDYPNALERIACGFCANSADIWVTSHPGYEFCLPETNIHDAASHGSLHVCDSISPLIAAGLPADVTLPDRLRIVDIAPLCRSLLGIDKTQAAHHANATTDAALTH